MRGVIAHAEGVLNDRRDPGRGPEVRGEAPREGPAQEQARNGLPLAFGEFRGTSRDRFRRQSGGTVLGDGLAPAHDGTMRAADLPGDLGDAVASVEEGDGPPAARLQFSLTAMWSHTALVRHPMAVRYLYWAQ